MTLPEHVSDSISDHLDAIKRHFKDSKVTVICRAVGFPDGSRDLVMTDDDLNEAKRAIETQQRMHRCEICDWPLAASREHGCVPGDCAYRPDDPVEQQRIRDRRAALAATKAIPGGAT